MYSLKPLLTTIIFFTAFSSTAQVNQTDTTGNIPPGFEKVESEAFYPGGNQAWAKYITKNMSSGVPSKDAPTGKYQAIAQFIVDKDGNTREVKALTKFGYGIEEELVRIIEQSGKWTPAIQNGKPLNAYRKQPLTFIVDSEDFEIATAEPYTLFTNIDNEITVTARKVKAADIGINVVGGSAIPVSDGKFIIRVKKPGRITIEILNSKKDDKEIGVASFEAKAK